MFSSAGQVSSAHITTLDLSDQMMMSGRWLVGQIVGGEDNFLVIIIYEQFPIFCPVQQGGSLLNSFDFLWGGVSLHKSLCYWLDTMLHFIAFCDMILQDWLADVQY